jgi:Protein of unknown function (DUF3179)
MYINGMKRSVAILLFVIGCLLLFATEILRVYFIMPFPGSQQHDTVGLAWWIDHYRLVLRFIGLILIVSPLARFWRRGRVLGRILLSVLIILYGTIFYFFNYRFEADKMFYQPSTVKFADAADNKIAANKLVIGVVVNNEAKAYPIQLIGYHHQVRDTFGSTPVMITYCTVCRTGRVFSPVVGGRPEKFRLVGMDHFNAMFEDASTGSWWQQATGAAVAGPLKAAQLAELPSAQLTLAEWLRMHPDSKILQPDTLYKKRYDNLADYDDGKIEGSLEHRDSLSWKPKSWVVGVRSGTSVKAYDWNDLVNRSLIQDTVGATPVLVLVGDDSATYHVWNRQVGGQTLSFDKVAGQQLLADNTGSQWDLSGRCISGKLKDEQLQPVQAYQEFWHSWSHFHPATTRFMAGPRGE